MLNVIVFPGKKSLQEIFQLYFMIKDRIFSKPKIASFGFSSDVFEEILKEHLDPDITMKDVTHPKLVHASVLNPSLIHQAVCMHTV